MGLTKWQVDKLTWRQVFDEANDWQVEHNYNSVSRCRTGNP
jgi:hypothetical protein